MSGEANETDLTGFLSSDRGLDGTLRSEHPFGIVVIVNFVKLPNVDHIGLQPFQAVMKMLSSAVSRSLPHTFVISTTSSRRPCRAFPMRRSDSPSQ